MALKKKKVVEAKKPVPPGARLAGHKHRYEVQSTDQDGSEYRTCVAGGGCTHAYTWRPGDAEP